jgi:FAD/FMN-containing dehydrogenase
VLEADRAWVRGLQAALAPHVVTRTYVNGLDEDSRDIRTAYGPEKYDRLRRIKAKYDPNNVFRRNANIKPGLPEQRTGS